MSTIVMGCDFERQDDPRFDIAANTFNPPPGTWAPDCGHPACIEDHQRCAGWHDWDCPVAVCRWNTSRDVCDLLPGHEGAHHFTLDPLTARPSPAAVGSDALPAAPGAERS